MPCAEAIVALLLLAAPSPEGSSPAAAHQQRYAMGTMFEILAYHPSQAEAERAVDAALAEVARLDQVMSHYRTDSELSRLVRTGRSRYVSVEPDLYEVVRQSIDFSRRSGGRFDVTIGPLVAAWREAAAGGRPPSEREIAAAGRCVGYRKIRTRPPDLIRLNSDCVAIDLGGIGKGYAVERAIGILQEAGIRHAVVNAGRSSIAAIGHPPGRAGWPIELGAAAGGPGLELRDRSLSSSQQILVPLAAGIGFGEILDPRAGRPLQSSMMVVVMAGSATTADALSTTLLLMTIDQGRRLLRDFPGASTWWLSADGAIVASHNPPGPRQAAEW